MSDEDADRFTSVFRRYHPRILAYDQAGLSRLLQPESRGYDRVIETCTRMVELVNRDGE